MTVAGLALALSSGCNRADAENAPVDDGASVSSATAIRVETATIVASSATVDTTMPGEIEGSRDAMLASALGGYVETIAVSEGQKVGAGALIARIDSDIHAASVARAQAQADQAHAEQARLEKLGDLATDQQRLSATTQVAVADAGLAQAKAQLRRAVITAPFAGVVADTFIDAGEVAGPGSRVARLVRLDPITVKLSVPDRDVVALREGEPVEVLVNARSGVFQGKVEHIGAAADVKTRAFPVDVTVPNPDNLLLPGMIARVHLSREVTGDGLILPQDLLVTRREDQGVFVVEGGKAIWRTVTLGAVVRDQVVVTAGLSAGDEVVVTGHRELVDGDQLIVSRRGVCCTAGRIEWAGGLQ